MIVLGIFDSASSWITGAIAVVTLGTAGGLGVGLGRIKDLRTQLADERATTAALRGDRDDDRNKVHQLELRLVEAQKIAGEQAAEIALLQKVLTGAVEWTVLTDQMAEAAKRQAEVEKKLTEFYQQALDYWDRSEKRAENHWSSIETKADAFLQHWVAEEVPTDEDGTKR